MLRQPVITKDDIVTALKKSGLKKGDIVFVHSSIGKFGYVKEAKDKFELANLIIDCFLDVIGRTGTLATPTFTYSFTKNETFDVDNTPSTVGAMTEALRKRKDAVRSVHPIFSIAAIGPKSKFLTSNLDKTCFGKNSVFRKLLQLNAKHVFFGTDLQSCTFIHLIERDYNVPYRYEKKFTGEIIANGKRYRDTYTYYVRYLNKNIKLYPIRFQKYLINKGLMSEVKLGRGYIRVISTKRLYEEGIKMLKRDIFYFLKTKPNI
jgi:aminoglycoside 3-N-acetyltransferase